MQKHTKEKQLNNAGFSLVELLIAIVILSIIVVPLLHSFVTSARTSAKARNTMHATAIAEDAMEEFEAYTIEKMAERYEDSGFTAEEDENGRWTFRKQDSSTTSGSYDVVAALDPTVDQYQEANAKELVDIQNLSGSLNAIYTEAEDAANDAYGYFATHRGFNKGDTSEEAYNAAIAELAPHVTKTIEITIDSSRIRLDLGSSGDLETDVYLVTARTQYHCETAWLEGPEYGDYPQNGSDSIIFSNEESVRKAAETLKKKSEAGEVLTDADKVISKLANIVICLQPRYEAADTRKYLDTVIVNNPDNVETNVFLVKQELSSERKNLLSEAFPMAVRENNYCVEYVLRESHPDWVTSDGIASCRLRTNMLPTQNVKYTFSNLSISGHTRTGEGYRQEDQTEYQPGGSEGAKVLAILSADTLTPKVQKNHIYNIEVQVFAQGTESEGHPLITMDGTVIQ